MSIPNTNDHFTWGHAYQDTYRGANQTTPSVKVGRVVQVFRENHLAQTYDVEELETGAVLTGCRRIQPAGGFHGVGTYTPLEEGIGVTIVSNSGLWDDTFITGIFFLEGNYNEFYSQGRLQKPGQLSSKGREFNQVSGHPNRVVQPDASITLHPSKNLYEEFTSPEFTNSVEDKAKANPRPGSIEMRNQVGDIVNYANGNIIQYADANVITISAGTTESKCTKLLMFAAYYRKQAALLEGILNTTEVKGSAPPSAASFAPIVSSTPNEREAERSLRSPFEDSYFIDQYKKLADLYTQQAKDCNSGDAARQLVTAQMATTIGSELPSTAAASASTTPVSATPQYKPKESSVPPAATAPTRGGNPKFDDAPSSSIISFEGIKIHKDAEPALRNLLKLAAEAGVSIKLLSGFRSVQQQQAIIDAKRARGIADATILKVNTPAGFSEHHTGFAFDFDDGKNPTNLNDNFDRTRAYAFIAANAKALNFELSYPRGNSQGIVYEPWHWRYVGTASAKTALKR